MELVGRWRDMQIRDAEICKLAPELVPSSTSTLCIDSYPEAIYQSFHPSYHTSLPENVEGGGELNQKADIEKIEK